MTVSGGDEFPDAFYGQEGRMAFIAMPDRGIDAQGAQDPHAADPEQKLLTEPDFLVSTVEPRGEGAIFGGMAGAIAGLITGVLNFVLNLILGTALAGLYKSLPSNVRDQIIARTAGGAIGIFTTPIFYGIWGVLAGIVLLSTVFKTNKSG